jgi:hypothetical protein
MPLFSLRLRARFEGPVASLSAASDHSLRVLFTCAACREDARAPSVFSWEDEVELPDGRATANLVQKCAACKSQFTVSITSKREDFRLPAEEAEAGRVVATLECRGCTPTAFVPGDGWDVSSASTGQVVWPAVDLSEAGAAGVDEWSEYDEASGEPVTVADVRGEFSVKR